MFIDDDPRRMGLYVEELREAGYEVVFHADVDTALTALEDAGEKVDLVVLDISMPPGNAFRFEDTVGGSRTGLPLYDKIRSFRPDVKVVAFTNVPDRRLAEHFSKEDLTVCRFIRKLDTLPSQFKELVDGFMSGTDV
jgi:CheY-like chemotaxis protein